MSKRPRAAADFLKSAAKAASSTPTTPVATHTTPVTKKSRVDTDGTSQPTQVNKNYDPESIADFKRLVQTTPGGVPSKALANLTTFERRVYALTKRIPAGRVATYKAIAVSLDCPRSYRAVGGALSHNPFAPHVPCHRVIASNGLIGGFAGHECALIKKKIEMLQNEGIQFDTSKTTQQLRPDASYRKQVMLEKIDATGLDAEMTDAKLMA